MNKNTCQLEVSVLGQQSFREGLHLDEFHNNSLMGRDSLPQVEIPIGAMMNIIESCTGKLRRKGAAIKANDRYAVCLLLHPATQNI